VMYIPEAFRGEDRSALVEFMQAESFATLVSVKDDGSLWASHLPLLVSERGGSLVLLGHVARANEHWKAFGATESLAIFNGPHAYVSPSLYESVESVPTWNYVAVHAYGVPRVLAVDAADGLERLLEAMMETYEPAYRRQWDGLPVGFKARMLHGIVGFEMPVARLEGKRKLSQNRSRADQERVAQALLGSPDPSAQAVGRLMEANLRRQEAGGR
jgi:transcriptional regulator